MTYNRSEIMRKANAYAKSMNRSAALRKAWQEAKSVEIAANELTVGDVISIAGLGGYEDNNFQAVITEVKPLSFKGSEKQFVVFYLNGSELNVCMEATDLVKKVA